MTTKLKTPYSLTLTKSERSAIDWVGHRDWNGNDLEMLLLKCEWVVNGIPSADLTGYDEYEWGESYDITFLFTEPQAWELHQMFEENGETIPHFADGLVSKFWEFFSKIV